jgi:hypothetical protein
VDDADLVDANREQAFPRLRDPNDTGIWKTEIKIVLPYKLNPARRWELAESLRMWAVTKDLEEPELITYIIQDMPNA